MINLLRMSAVKSSTGYRSHASVYNGIRDGLFPKGVKIGQRSVAWPDTEVYAINAARIAGKSNDDIRALVTRLHAKRTELVSV